MTLIARATDFLARDYPRYQLEGWSVIVEMCELCGRCDWKSSSDEGKDFKVSVELASSASCERCCEVARRAPEIFNWVLNVVRRQGEKAQEPQEGNPT